MFSHYAQGRALSRFCQRNPSIPSIVHQLFFRQLFNHIGNRWGLGVHLLGNGISRNQAPTLAQMVNCLDIIFFWKCHWFFNLAKDTIYITQNIFLAQSKIYCAFHPTPILYRCIVSKNVIDLNFYKGNIWPEKAIFILWQCQGSYILCGSINYGKTLLTVSFNHRKYSTP